MSFDRLQEKIDELRNPTVVGLDPALEHIPTEIIERNIREHGETFWAAALAISEFNIMLINALYDVVPAVKPQLAFFELLGAEGIVALEMTCKYAMNKGLYVICDGKRNDIGSTAEAYSAAYLGSVRIGDTELQPFKCDALTVNAYLGSDGLKPFLDMAVKNDKALFALVKTSNPSAGELQDLWVCEKTVPATYVPQTLYTTVGDQIESIALDTVGRYGYTRVGAVVGATYPEELQFLRARLKNTFFLVPGYGAQGGAANDVAHAFDYNKRGAIVNSSRAIIAAWKKTGNAGEDYAEAARAEAIVMRDALRAALSL